MTDHRRGLLAGVADTLLWASSVLYWPHLKPAGDAEILGHRLVWACVLMLAIVALTGRLGSLGRLLRDRRTTLLLVGAAVSITINWAGLIWGVNHDHVVEASLGLFINPLVTVLIGVLVLRESVRPWQVVAIGLAGLAVVVVTVAYGRVPWFALMLAASGGLYGMFKKRASAGALESLTVETMVVAPFALVWLVVQGSTGASTFAGHGLRHALLLAGGGLVTVTPLIFFGYAASRVSLVLLGVISYLAPVGTFILGLAYFHESLQLSQLIGYVLVWAALGTFGFDAVRAWRAGPVAVQPPAGAGVPLSDAAASVDALVATTRPTASLTRMFAQTVARRSGRRRHPARGAHRRALLAKMVGWPPLSAIRSCSNPHDSRGAPFRRD